MIFTFKRFAKVTIYHLNCWSNTSVFCFYSRCYLLCSRFVFPFLIWWQAKYLSFFKLSLDTLLFLTSAPWFSVYHYCATWFNKSWTEVLCSFKSYSRHVRDLRWWESLTVIPARKNASRPLFVNRYAKTENAITQDSF